MYQLKCIFLFGLIATLITSAARNQRSQTNTDPEVFYINLDSSIDRRVNVESQLRRLGLRFHRVRGQPWQEIYIPQDFLIYNVWQTAWCSSNTSEVIPDRSSVLKNASSPLYPYSAIMNGLCGRGASKHGHKNTFHEIGCTVSHILAMQKAINSPTAKSKYALIIEDDVELLFDIDFEAMAATAPKDFGILQLFNSNKVTMLHTWKRYNADNSNLWYRSEYLKYWSTCAYLINREVMRPIVNAIAYHQDGWQQFKLIAGISGPCAPRECCINGNDSRWGYWGKDVQFIAKPPCILSEKGLQADVYLYAATKTYMLSVPLIANGIGGGVSTFHQDHVELLHRAAFKQQRQIINAMLSGKTKPPPFVRAMYSTLTLNESLI